MKKLSCLKVLNADSKTKKMNDFYLMRTQLLETVTSKVYA